jgi:hypothetical protein
MRRLVFLVEGDTELTFINNHVIPYLYLKGYPNPMQAQKVVTNRQLQKKGGNINYAYLENDINRIMGQGNVIITTFLDLFRIPTNFPGYSNTPNADAIEAAMHQAMGSHKFYLPYIQRHEMEALMFSSMAGFDIVIDDPQKLNAVSTIIEQYGNPEDINNSPNTAPSKRLEAIFNYDKVVDGELILEAIGIKPIIAKCPRFAAWLDKLELLLQIPG